MKKFQIRYLPTKVSELAPEDFYEEPSQDWRDKAEKLQARRWRALKQHMKYVRI